MFIHYGFVPNVIGQGVALLVSVWELLKANIFPEYGCCDKFLLILFHQPGHLVMLEMRFLPLPSTAFQFIICHYPMSNTVHSCGTCH
jgi:hypothetical protein